MGLALVLGVLSTVAALHAPTGTEAAPTIPGYPNLRDHGTPIPVPARPEGDRPSLTSSVGPLLGELTSPAYRILVYAAADGPRYTVLDHDGQILYENLEADEVYRVVPGLDVRDLHTIAPGGTPALMRATEPADW